MGKEASVRLIGRLEDGSAILQHADGHLERQQERTDWTRLETMSEAEIEAGAEADPDNPPLDATFFATAQPVTLPRKRRVTMMLDGDVIEYFAREGRGYQTRINAVLRRYMEAIAKVG
jgi:uncharacterized protein (DUF4415 family)